MIVRTDLQAAHEPADESRGHAAVVLPITVNGISVKGDLTVVTMNRGKLQSEITYTGVGLPFSTSVERHLDAVAYGRT